MGNRDGYRRVEYSDFKNWTIWLDAHQPYPNVKVPVMLIYGGDDWSHPHERERERNHVAIPGAELFTTDQAGHFAALEKPAEVAARILRQRAHQAHTHPRT